VLVALQRPFIALFSGAAGGMDTANTSRKCGFSQETGLWTSAAAGQRIKDSRSTFLFQTLGARVTQGVWRSYRLCVGRDAGVWGFGIECTRRLSPDNACQTREVP
jgi:hypothetical protein